MVDKNIYREDNKILSVKNLKVNFTTDHGMVHAARGVSFDLYKGETLCIVGESGSGKSVTSKTIMGILAANGIIEDGQIIYEGEDLVRVSEEDFHRIRGHKIGMIFQDPLSSLNPLVRVGKQIIETTMINNNILKRMYNDLISNDLTAYRNVFANENYELNKTKKIIKDNKRLIKKQLRINQKLAKPSKKEEEYKKELEKVNEDIKVYANSFVSNIPTDIEGYNIQKDLENKAFDNLSKDDDGVNKDLRVKKHELKIKSIDDQINLLNEYKDKFSEELTDDDKVLIINQFLNKKIEVTKNSTKEQSPTLKEILKERKEFAKKTVNEYHAKLKKEKEEKLADLNDKKRKYDAEFESYKASMDPELLNKCLEVYTYNIALAKKLKKEEGKFKENSVSKTVAKTETFKDYEDAKFKEYIDGIEALKQEEEAIKEDYISKTKITYAEARKRALEVMKEVGIPLPERRFRQYPFEFSGGMRQRIVIAIALTANPDILICDEPTTALDVTIQAQILELINKLKRERNLSCIFITHDLGVVANMADRVAVMYAGKIVEYGMSEEVFFDPKHPYTWALLSSIPDVDSKEKLEAIPGTPPDMRFPPKGDAFALRSKYAMNIDFKYEPPFFKVSDTHYAATWLLYPGAPKVEMPKIVKTRIDNALKAQKEKEGGKKHE
jgi:oligopeptide/dipeptide ABC transporter ATP-binding protein